MDRKRRTATHGTETREVSKHVPAGTRVLTAIPTPTAPGPQPPAVAFTACSAPSDRDGPQFVLNLRRPILLSDIGDARSLPGVDPAALTLASASLQYIDAWVALDNLFEQTWNLTGLSIGDLESTIALAPAEQLTLEFTRSQRKVMDRSVTDSTETIDSSEATTTDKEAMNVTRATTKTQNWHVDASGTLTVGYATLNVTGGYSQTVTEQNQATINHVTESTKKSAHSLKSLHKIEVRGVTETLIQNRMTRLIKNPYIDRSLAVNVYQLIKKFSVETALAETRIALVLRLGPPVFDALFVVNNTDFLRQNLLDSDLLDQLANAVQGAGALVPLTSLQTAQLIATRALYHLFENPNMFNVNKVGGVDANSPASSFNAQITSNFWWTGLGDSLQANFGTLYAVLAFFNALYHDSAFPRDTATSPDNTIRLAVALANDLDDRWKIIFTDPKTGDIKDAMDDAQFTEILRRIPGFISTVKGMLLPLLDPAKSDSGTAQTHFQNQLILDRLLKHLSNNASYYLQEYLRYLSLTTRGHAITDLAASVVSQLSLNGLLPVPLTADALDTDRSFVDTTNVVIPGYVTLNGQQAGQVLGLLLQAEALPVNDPIPVLQDIAVPADGIHLEATAGACVLSDVPAPPDLAITASVSDAKLNITGS